MSILKIFDEVYDRTKGFTECDLGEGCVYCGKKTGAIVMFCRLCGTQRCFGECSDEFHYARCPKCNIIGTEKDELCFCNEVCWMELEETAEKHGNSARFWTTWGLTNVRNPIDPRPYLDKAMSKLMRGAEMGDPLAFLVVAMIYYTWYKDANGEHIGKEIYRKIKHLFPEKPELLFFKRWNPHKLYNE